jgi:hypothetical protein
MTKRTYRLKKRAIVRLMRHTLERAGVSAEHADMIAETVARNFLEGLFRLSLLRSVKGFFWPDFLSANVRMYSGKFRFSVRPLFLDVPDDADTQDAANCYVPLAEELFNDEDP